jgi:hypothetical protein
MTETTAAGRKVLDALADNRQDIEYHKRELDKCYGKQNRLYVKGSKNALRATDMARAIGAETAKEVASGAEAIRQVIKRDGG